MTTPLHQFARAAASLGVLQIGGMALTFLVGLLLARQLGPAGYGVYALAMAVTAFAGMLTEFGLPILTMREFAKADASKQWAQAKGLFSWSQMLILSLATIVLCSFFALMQFFDFGQKSAFLATMAWAVLLVPIVALAKLRALALLSLGHTVSGQFSVLVLRPALFALALGIFWYLGRDLEPTQAMFWQVAAAFAALIAVALFFRALQPQEYRDSNKEYQRASWLRSSIPMGATEGLRLLQGQLAIILLGVFAAPEEVGLYRVADAATLICLVPASILFTISSPYIAKLHAAGEKLALQNLLSLISLASTLILVIASTVLFFLGERLVTLAFGTEFIGSVPALLVLAFGWVFISAMGPASVLANMTGHEREVTIASIAAVGTQLLAAIFLIPALATVGAAVSVIAGQLTFFTILVFKAKRRADYDPTIFSARFLPFAYIFSREGIPTIFRRP